MSARLFPSIEAPRGWVPRPVYYLAQKLALEPRERYRSRDPYGSAASRRAEEQAAFEARRADALRAAEALQRKWEGEGA